MKDLFKAVNNAWYEQSEHFRRVSKGFPVKKPYSIHFFSEYKKFLGGKKGGAEMQITRLEYPVCGKKKYRVIYNNKEYTCYLVSFGDNFVVTGDGNAENFEDITMTKLGTRIIIECHKAD